MNKALLSGEYVMVSNVAGAACLVTEENGEIIDINMPYIDFKRASIMNGTLSKRWILRESRMPFSFKDKMNDLIFRLSQVERHT